MIFNIDGMSLGTSSARGRSKAMRSKKQRAGDRGGAFEALPDPSSNDCFANAGEEGTADPEFLLDVDTEESYELKVHSGKKEDSYNNNTTPGPPSTVSTKLSDQMRDEKPRHSLESFRSFITKNPNIVCKKDRFNVRLGAGNTIAYSDISKCECVPYSPSMALCVGTVKKDCVMCSRVTSCNSPPTVVLSVADDVGIYHFVIVSVVP